MVVISTGGEVEADGRVEGDWRAPSSSSERKREGNAITGTQWADTFRAKC